MCLLFCGGAPDCMPIGVFFSTSTTPDRRPIRFTCVQGIVRTQAFHFRGVGWGSTRSIGGQWEANGNSIGIQKEKRIAARTESYIQVRFRGEISLECRCRAPLSPAETREKRALRFRNSPPKCPLLEGLPAPS